MPSITHIAATLTTIAMAALGLGVDIRVVAKSGVRVTLAVTASLIVLGLISYALIRVAGILASQQALERRERPCSPLRRYDSSVTWRIALEALSCFRHRLASPGRE